MKATAAAGADSAEKIALQEQIKALQSQVQALEKEKATIAKAEQVAKREAEQSRQRISALEVPSRQNGKGDGMLI